MNRLDVQRMRATKRELEANPWAHSFRAVGRFKPNAKPADAAMLLALKRNGRLSKLSDKRVRAEGEKAGASAKVVEAYLQSRAAKRV